MNAPPDRSPAPFPAPAPVRQRWRLRVAIAAPGGSEVVPGAVEAAVPAAASAAVPAAARSWPAILAESGLPIAGEGVGRSRVVPACPLPIGVAGEREVVDLYLTQRLPAATVRGAVAAVLPAGLALVDLHDVWVGAPSAPAGVVAADYRVQVAGVARWVVEGAILALLGAATLPRERRREKKVTAYDLRPLILGLEVRASDGSGVTLAMRLRHAPEAVGRPEEVVAALGELPGAPLPAPIVLGAIIRERIVMADDVDVATAGPGPVAPAAG